MTLFQVNEWLDEYNDYMLLYRMFGDQTYVNEADEIMKSMERYVSKMLMLEKCKLTL
ncbi:hypothetical protein SAMN05216378_3339 [Paenibacillus catalpae]|uniref:Uncharacterized protein n=1 Tax=Paenibacillus catalpae TaxID=1045775 RepID=A0A1I2B2H0_9BACL|nr:hypothetical protein SAMN05216378_3339 [Paenibacillus catalpae]